MIMIRYCFFSFGLSCIYLIDFLVIVFWCVVCICVFFVIFICIILFVGYGVYGLMINKLKVVGLNLVVVINVVMCCIFR